MCIWVTRWFCCPEPCVEDINEQPAHITDPTRPWESWRPNDPISPEQCANLRLRPYAGFSYVRHRQVLKIRCALPSPRRCCEAPRETHTEVYRGPCPPCSGHEVHARCEQPMVKHISEDHYSTSRHGRELLDKALCQYFLHIVSWQWTVMQLLLGDKGGHPGLLYEHTACSEHYEHNVFDSPDRPANPRCDSCDSINMDAAHSVTRALLRHEALVARAINAHKWHQGLELTRDNRHVMARFRARGMDRADEGTPHVYHAEAPPGSERLLQSIDRSHFLQMLRSHKIMINQASWNRRLERRRWLVGQLLLLVVNDPGLSTVFRELLLRRYILHLYEPVPSEDFQHGEIDFAAKARCLGEAVAMVRWFNELVVTHPAADANMDRLRWCGDQFRNSLTVIRANGDEYLRHSTERHEHAAAYMYDRCVTVKHARQSESACGICQCDFDLAPGLCPRAWRVAETPCCRKPLHFKCFTPLYVRKLRCPYCRADLRQGDVYDLERWDCTPDIKDVPRGYLSQAYYAQ